ncbi:MAG TPA: hypothetical protein VFS60_07890, partial [Thermoanaerobaculia bacterium]|nr:hypothetical protein [Thermoanaerobaculia bacterium]
PTGKGQLAAWPAIITGGPGTGSAVTNYRTEPPPLRVAPGSGKGAAEALDLAHVYRSIPRQDPELNRQPYGPITAGSPFLYPGGFLGADDFDPYTPLLRTYQGDRVQVRLLAGAHVAPHFFTTHGLRWLFEPSDPDSGYLATQGTGLSEHFELLFQVPKTPSERGLADYLWVGGAGQADLVQGLWGLLRAYDPKKPQEGLPALPRTGAPPPAGCPAGAPRRSFDVTAVSAAKALASSGGSVAYNSRLPAGTGPLTTLQQPDGLLYVHTRDLDANGQLKPGVPVEPLVLRANAGECLKVTLRNGLDPEQVDSGGNPIFTTPLPQAMGDLGDTVDLYPSTQVGLRPQLVGFDVTRDGAYNVGRNTVQTVPPGGSRTFTWYAGVAGKPVELGFGNLLPADPLMQDPLGLFAGLVIEPAGSKVHEDATMRTAATVRPPAGKPFRELVLFTQSDVLTIQPGQNGAPASYGSGLSWTASGNSNATPNAINYRSEPIAYRTASPNGDISAVLTNAQVGGDPQTPVLVAASRQPVRFRLGQVNGTGDAENLTIHGHGWQEEPFRAKSTVEGDNPLSQWFGIAPHGPENHVNLLLGPAGGPGGVTGDYLFRSFFAQGNFNGGEWGLLRVLSPGLDSVAPGQIAPCAENMDAVCVAGTNTVNPETGKLAARNEVYEGRGLAGRLLGSAPIDPATGRWSFTFSGEPPAEVTVRSDLGATAVAVATAQVVEAEAPRALAAAPSNAAAEARVKRAQSFRKHRGPGGPVMGPESGPQGTPQQ